MSAYDDIDRTAGCTCGCQDADDPPESGTVWVWPPEHVADATRRIELITEDQMFLTPTEARALAVRLQNAADDAEREEAER